MATSKTTKFMPEGGKNEKRRSLPLTRDDTFSEEIHVRSNQEKTIERSTT
jgi:hypothetical protein